MRNRRNITHIDPRSVAHEPADPTQPRPSCQARAGHTCPPLPTASFSLEPRVHQPWRAPPEPPQPHLGGSSLSHTPGGRWQDHGLRPHPLPQATASLSPWACRVSTGDRCLHAPDSCCPGTPRGACPEALGTPEEAAGGAGHSTTRRFCSQGPTGGTHGLWAAPRGVSCEDQLHRLQGWGPGASESLFPLWPVTNILMPCSPHSVPRCPALRRRE